ncbi:hypothetical protein ACYX79_13380 [Stenotrophomonas rhizophila]
MQKMNGEAVDTPTFTLASSTGPEAEAITGVGIEGVAQAVKEVANG